MNKIDTNVAKKAIYNSWNCIDDYNCKNLLHFMCQIYVCNTQKDNERGEFSRWVTCGEAWVKLCALLTSAEDKINLSALCSG